MSYILQGVVNLDGVPLHVSYNPLLRRSRRLGPLPQTVKSWGINTKTVVVLTLSPDVGGGSGVSLDPHPIGLAGSSSIVKDSLFQDGAVTRLEVAKLLPQGNLVFHLDGPSRPSVPPCGTLLRVGEGPGDEISVRNTQMSGEGRVGERVVGTTQWVGECVVDDRSGHCDGLDPVCLIPSQLRCHVCRVMGDKVSTPSSVLQDSEDGWR